MSVPAFYLDRVSRLYYGKGNPLGVLDLTELRRESRRSEKTKGARVYRAILKRRILHGKRNSDINRGHLNIQHSTCT